MDGRRPARQALGALTVLAFALAGCGTGAAGAPPPAAGPAVVQPTPTAPAAVPRPVLAGDIATGLRLPWGLDFLPDGDALVTERDTRRVLRVSPQGEVTPVGEVPEAEGTGEGGLLGIAISPTFATDALVYVYLSTPTDNRIVRMTYDGASLGPRQPLVTGIPSAVNHDGGVLEFGPDGMLYAGTGDAEIGPLAQDPASLGGKILRMTPDGRPAPGNPIPDSVVYSLGHRNVQGLAFDAQGRLWASEFGYRTWDELNLVRPGGNYGWPEVEGRVQGAAEDGRFVQPVAQWRPADASPSGITVVDGVVYMAALRGQRLWQIPLAGEGVGEPVASLVGERGRLRAVEQAPDGSLWITTSNLDKLGRPGPGDDRIARVTLTS